MICGSRGSKSRLAKAAGAEPAGQRRDEQLHAVVAWSTFPSQDVQNTPRSDHFWKLRCRKSARRCSAKHISKSKCKKTQHVRTTFGSSDVEKVHAVVVRSTFPSQNVQKTLGVRTTFGSWDVEKVHAVVARSTFRSQNVQNTTCSRHFWRFRCRFAWQAQGIVHLVSFVAFQEWWQAWDIWRGSAKMHFRGRRGGQGADFLRGVAFWSIRCAGLLRWFCVTGAALRMTWHQFSQAQCFRQVDRKNRKTHWYESVSSALNFPFLKDVSQNSSFLMSCTSQNEEVSQNCFVSDVVKFKKWRRLHYTKLHYTTLHSTTLHYTTLHYTTLHYTEWHCTTDRQVDR